MATAKRKKRAAAPSSKAVAPMTRHQAARTEFRAALYRDAVEGLAAFPEWTPESRYSEGLGLAMAACVAGGTTLDQLGSFAQCPPVRELCKWVVDAGHPFSKLYYGAKDLMVPLLEERALTIATTSLIGTRRRRYQSVTRDGDVEDLEESVEFDNVERSKLAVATYSWALEHMAPKKHGRKADPDSGRPNEQLEALFQALKAGPAS